MESKGQQLRDACGYIGNFDEVKRLVDEEGVDVESSDDRNRSNCDTPLMKAAMHGHVDIVRFLLDRGANIDNRSDIDDTALHYAAYYGHDEIVKLLIERGANLHVRDDHDNRTPLDDAKNKNKSSTVAIIKKATKSTKSKNEYLLILITSLYSHKHHFYHITF